MKIGFITDIHGAQGDLDAALFELKQNGGVDAIACLGDIIGRGGYSYNCYNTVRQKCKWVLMGNHDAVVAFGNSMGFNFPEKDQPAIEEARGLFYGDDEFADMPTSVQYNYYDDAIVMVHASPIDTLWTGISKAEDMRAAFAKENGARIIVAGHTHRACYGTIDASGRDGFKNIHLEPGGSFKLKLQSGRRYFMNPGAIIDARSYMILDLKENTCEWRKCEEPM